MCTIYSLLILAAVSLPAFVSAEGNLVARQNEAVTLPAPTTPKPLCEEKICPRLYWPVCSLVDGQQVTAPSPCVLNNKIRCTRLLRQSMGRNIPTIRFLHAGACSPQTDRSNVVRMRDAADVVGNETTSKQAGKKEASFAEIIYEMIDEILYGDSGDSDEYDEDFGSDEEDEDIIDGILSGESFESDEDSDDIIDGNLESVENGGDGSGNLEEIDDDYKEPELDEDEGEVLHRRREAKIDKSWL